MKTLRKWWKFGLAVLALLVAAQAGVSLLARTRRVHAYLIAHLERAFGRPVEVGNFDVRILPSPQLGAEAITVGEDPAFGYEYFLRAERLSAGLRWMGLLRGHFEFGTMSLSKPSLILVRNQEGRWNLERWLPAAKSTSGPTARIYGPSRPLAPVNRLERIEFDDGRINFKNGEDKLAFAFTNVSGNVEQVAPGRWQMQLEAQPWRSGVLLQSTGKLNVRGDVAGTSARLQPAEITLHWSEASLADVFRLLRGQDHGLRGVFGLDATTKSAGGQEEQAGDWTFSVQARATHIHRWDLTERADNPWVNANLKGRWNAGAGSLVAEQLAVEAPGSNLRGQAKLLGASMPSMELRLDSMGIQAADLLAWYRAFHPGVAEGVTAEQYFTGGMILRGWPLQVESAAFSSGGGFAKVPGLSEPIVIGEMRGGRERNKFVMEPVRLSLGGQEKATGAPVKSVTAAPKKRVSAESRSGAFCGFSYDFESQFGVLSIEGQTDKVEEMFKVATAFGRTLNHGWELTGGATAALRWGWADSRLPGRWDGRAGFTKVRVQAAGLNQPLQFESAQLEWKEGKRSAEISKALGFGATWSGNIAELPGPAAGGAAAWTFKLHADHLDATELDRWVGPRARPGWLQRLLPSLLGGSASSSPASELLRRLNATGELRVDELTVEKLKLRQVRAEGTLHELQAEVRDAEAQWADGKVRLKMNAKFSPRPSYEVAAELDRVNLAQFPGAGRIAEQVAGLASGKIKLKTEGVGRDELIGKLKGQGDFHLTKVEFRGWDVNASLADGAARAGVSRWAAGEAFFSIQDRGILLDELRLEAPKESTVVTGTLSFGRDANLAIQTASAPKGKGPKPTDSETGHVLKISGPLDGPKISVEKAGLRQPAD